MPSHPYINDLNDDLLTAAECGDEVMVLSCLARGASALHADYYGKLNALMLAVEFFKPNATIVHALINAGDAETISSDVKYIDIISEPDDDYGNTHNALGRAAANSLLAVKMLIDAGASTLVSPTDKMLISPLSLAVKHKRYDAVQFLIDSGADVNHTHIEDGNEFNPLINAILNNDAKMVEILIKAGADVNFSYDGALDEHRRGSAADNILLLALDEFKGDPDIINQLVKAGADIHYINVFGYDLLESAIETGKVELVKMVAELGFNLEEKMHKIVHVDAKKQATDTYANKAIINAAKNDHDEMIKLCLEYGADIETTHNASVTTPLTSTLNFGGFKPKAFKTLLEAGADYTIPHLNWWIDRHPHAVAILENHIITTTVRKDIEALNIPTRIRRR